MSCFLVPLSYRSTSCKTSLPVIFLCLWLVLLPCEVHCCSSLAMKRSPKMSKVESYFHQIDNNLDGYITWVEWFEDAQSPIYMNMVPVSKSNHILWLSSWALSQDQARKMFVDDLNNDNEISESEFKYTFKRVDKNCDGKITLEEFKAA